MRLNDLLGRPVLDADGDEIGGVADVRLVQDGPMLVSMRRSLRVDGLIVVEHRATRLFGYERHVGPALLRRLVHWRLGEVWYLPWADVDSVTTAAVTIAGGRTDLHRLEDHPRL